MSVWNWTRLTTKACTVSAELLELFQVANSDFPAIVSEAPGPHDILGWCDTPRVDAHVTTSALAAESSFLESVALKALGVLSSRPCAGTPLPLVFHALSSVGGSSGPDL